MAWEDIGAQQHFVGWLVGGFLSTSFVLPWIARATRSQLMKWKDETIESKAPYNECLVCNEQKPCLYICKDTQESDQKHNLCAECHHGVIHFGNGLCPMCRCSEFMTNFTEEDVRVWSLWLRLKYKGIVTGEWVANKILQYYSWRGHNVFPSLMVDFIQTALLARIVTMRNGMISGINVANGFSSGIALGRNLFPWFQMDDWDEQQADPEPGPSGTQPIGRDDEFTPRINEDILRKTLEPGLQMLCLHDKLQNATFGVKAIKTGWQVVDTQTTTYIVIPYEACKTETCFVRQELYTTQMK